MDTKLVIEKIEELENELLNIKMQLLDKNVFPNESDINEKIVEVVRKERKKYI